MGRFARLSGFIVLAFFAGPLVRDVSGAAYRSGAGPDPFASARLRIARILKETAASGVAVAVAKDGKIVWEEGFGTTSRDGGTPVMPDTMFSLASLTKPLTATALMVLVERGLVDLDKPANGYLGPAKLTSLVEGARPATVRDLIYHVSGLPMHWHLFYADKPRRAPLMDDSIRAYGILTGAPGESYEYSNFGYGILGHIAARAARKPYYALMKEAVFDPLGMTRTMILTAPAAAENLAVKYDGAKKELPISDFDHQGASSAYSSVRDLVRFAHFRMGRTAAGSKPILKKETLEAMRTQSGSAFMDSGRRVRYLLGSFADIEFLGARFQTATGGMPGAVSRLDIVPSENIVSAVLANSDGVDLWAIQHEILAAFLPAFRDTPYSPPKAADPGAGKAFRPPAPLVGRWSGFIRTPRKDLPAALVFAEDGGVRLEIDGKRNSPLPVKTELGDMNFTDGVFSGLFWGRIPTPDTAGQSHVVYVSVRLRGGTLTGSASAVSIDSRRTFCLPHGMVLTRSGS
jgi:CubicO group peptidase (beta-lactamase class C family)